MELDEMKLAWQTLSRQLEKQNALSLRLFKDSTLDKARKGLWPLLWGQSIQMAIGLVLAILAGTFWATRLHITHLLICGLVVHAYGLMLVVFAARNLYLIHRIDYAASVIVIQSRLADLRAWKYRVETPFNAVLGCFIWIPVTWMNLAWHGIDLWTQKGTFVDWALSSSCVGLALVMVVNWLMRRMGYAHVIENNAVGRSVQRMDKFLDEIVRFERE